jgi:hypothetical protein
MKAAGLSIICASPAVAARASLMKQRNDFQRVPCLSLTESKTFLAKLQGLERTPVESEPSLEPLAPGHVF